MTGAVHPMDVITEATLQKLVENYCVDKGLLYYHTHDSRRSVAGYPDLTIIGANGIMLVELKSETGRLSRSQRCWVDAAIATKTPVRVWNPRQWRDGTISAELDQLARGSDVVRTIVRRCATALRDEQKAGAVRRSLRPKLTIGGVEQ